MRTRLILLSAAVALLLAGCYEAEDEYTINPDGSGKLVFTRIIKLTSPMGGPGGEDPEGMLKMFVADMLNKWKGIEAWKDVTFAIQDDGRGRIQGTAYFTDIRAVGTGEEINALKGVVITREGDRSWRIVLGEGGKDAAARKAPEAGAAPAPTQSAEDLKKAARAKRAEYQAQRPMLEMFLGDLKVVRRFRVPGKIASVRALAQESESVARYSFDGAKLLEAMDKAMSDDAFLQASLQSSPSEEGGPPIPAGLDEMMLGGGPPAIEATGDLKDLFDYRAEVAAAKGAAETLAALGIAPGGASASAAETAPEPLPVVEAGPVAVTASARLSSVSGIKDDKAYSIPVEVRLAFSGGVAGQAHRVGKVEISAATGEFGEALEAVAFSPGHELPGGFVAVNRAEAALSTDEPVHPPDGFGIAVSFIRPEAGISRVGRLAGTVTVETAARTTIEDLGALLPAPGKVELNDPGLARVGSFSLSLEGKEATVSMEGRKARIEGASARLLDAAGAPLFSAGSMSMGSGEDLQKSLQFRVAGGSLAGARLEVLAPAGTAVVPFEVRDVEVAQPLQMPRAAAPAPPAVPQSGLDKPFQIVFDQEDPCCSVWFGGDSGRKRNVGVGESVFIERTTRLQEYGFKLSGPFEFAGKPLAAPVTVRVQVRDAGGGLLASSDAKVEPGFAGGWVLASFDIVLPGGARYVFTSFLVDGENVRASSAASSGENDPFPYGEAYTAEGTGVALESWPTWQDHSDDFLFTLRGMR